MLDYPVLVRTITADIRGRMFAILTTSFGVLRMKECQWLGPPHVLRGVIAGLLALAMKPAMEHLNLPDQYPGYATAVNYAAGVLGGIALGLIADRWGAGRSSLFGDVLFAAGLATMMVFHNPLVFLALYFLVHFGRNIEDTAVPFGCTIIVPPELMGAFSAARLTVLTGSGSLGALAGGDLLEWHGPVAVFGVAAVLKLLNGVWFWYVFRLRKPAEGASWVGAD